MTPDQIVALAAAGESVTLEFKKSTAEKDRACRTLCAFANGQAHLRHLFGQAFSESSTCDAVTDVVSRRRDCGGDFVGGHIGRNVGGNATPQAPNTAASVPFVSVRSR